MKKLKIIFVSVYMLISVWAVILLFKEQKDVMNSENRTAQKIPSFSITEFLNNNYQTDLEEALSDQFIKGESLKTYLIGYQNTLYNGVYSNLFYNNRENSYYSVSKGYMGFDNADYLLYGVYSNDIVQTQIDDFKKVAEPYNNIKNVDKYLYFVNTEQTIDFRNVNNDIYNDITDLYDTFKSDSLKINSFDDYKNYFYKTDHHWNYKGSYQGYKDIINLMLGENETLIEPKEEKIFPFNFYGTKANRSKFYSYKENFAVYTFDIPSHKTYINGEEKEYGASSSYLKGEYNTDKNISQYAAYYGGDYAEIVYDFNQSDKENLLIISGSFSNAINELVASHFNKTYIIDLRHYENFNVDEYINQNEIDKFIFITYISHCKTDEFLLGGQE